MSKGLKVSFAVSSPIEIFLANTLLLPEANCLIIDERKAFSRESRRGEFQLRSSIKSSQVAAVAGGWLEMNRPGSRFRPTESETGGATQ